MQRPTQQLPQSDQNEIGRFVDALAPLPWSDSKGFIGGHCFSHLPALHARIELMPGRPL
jgi:hypothetical protein